MNTFKLDEKNNIVAVTEFEIISDIDAIAQDVKTMLNLHYGEYIYNTNIGIPWYEFFQTQDAQVLLSEIESNIYRDERISQVIIDVDKIKNTLIINIKTTKGEEATINVG